jgi:hypothetical protein
VVEEDGVQLVAIGAGVAVVVGLEVGLAVVREIQPGRRVKVSNRMDAIKSQAFVFIFFIVITYNKIVNSILIIYEKPPLRKERGFVYGSGLILLKLGGYFRQ